MQKEEKEVINFEPKAELLKKIQTGKLHENSIKEGFTNRTYEQDYRERLELLHVHKTNFDLLIGSFDTIIDKAPENDPMKGYGVAAKLNLLRLYKTIQIAVEDTHKLYEYLFREA